MMIIPATAPLSNNGVAAMAPSRFSASFSMRTTAKRRVVCCCCSDASVSRICAGLRKVGTITTTSTASACKLGERVTVEIEG